MNQITKYGDLSSDQKKFLFSELSHPLKKSFNDIRIGFENFFETKIEPSLIIKFNENFKAQIEQEREKLLNDINSVPIACAVVRLHYIYEGLKDAFTKKTTYKKCGEEYIPIEEINHTAAEKYLKLAQNEEYMSKKLLLEYIKAKSQYEVSKPKAGFVSIPINDGLEWDEDES